MSVSGMGFVFVDRAQITKDPRQPVDELAVSILIDRFEAGMRAGFAKKASQNGQ
jgi:hypothetical protein